MAVKKYKPVTPGQRGMTGYTFEEITKSNPERSLIVIRREHAGRECPWSYHRPSSWWRQPHATSASWISSATNGISRPKLLRSNTIQTGPHAWRCLIYADGEKRYIVAPLGLKVGDTLLSGSQAEIRPGNCLPLANIPVGTMVHNIELKSGKGGQLVRSAGESAQLLAKEGEYAQVRLPSGEVRLVRQVCYATIGQIGNVDHSNIKLGKAGRKRHMGIRPTVRGTAMSPRDHPHGGGEGRQPTGMPGPKTPWGRPTRGYKTRNNKTDG